MTNDRAVRQCHARTATVNEPATEPGSEVDLDRKMKIQVRAVGIPLHAV